MPKAFVAAKAFGMRKRAPSAIGRRLGRVRGLAGLSARELDRLAGIAEGHTSLLESIVGDVKATTLAKIARVLGVSIDWFVNGTGAMPTRESLVSAIETARRAYAKSAKPAA